MPHGQYIWKLNHTYIEKDGDGSRVYIVRRVTDRMVITQVIDFHDQRNYAAILKDKFIRRFELSPIQIK